MAENMASNISSFREMVVGFREMIISMMGRFRKRLNSKPKFRYRMALYIITAIYMWLYFSIPVLAYYAASEIIHIDRNFKLFSSHYATIGYVLIITILFHEIGVAMLWFPLLYLERRYAKLAIRIGRIFTAILVCISSAVIIVVIVLNHSDWNGSTMSHVIRKYLTEKATTEAIDEMQTNFSCCGIVGSEDWKFNGLFTCESNMSQFLCGVPHSCCKDKDIIKENQTGSTTFCGLSKLKLVDGVFQTENNGTSKAIPSDIMHLEGCLSKIEPIYLASTRKILIFASCVPLVQCFSILLQYGAIVWWKRERALQEKRLIDDEQTNVEQADDEERSDEITESIPLRRHSRDSSMELLEDDNKWFLDELTEVIPEHNDNPATMNRDDSSQTCVQDVDQGDSNSRSSTSVPHDDMFYYDAESVLTDESNDPIENRTQVASGIVHRGDSNSRPSPSVPHDDTFYFDAEPFSTDESDDPIENCTQDVSAIVHREDSNSWPSTSVPHDDGLNFNDFKTFYTDELYDRRENRAQFVSAVGQREDSNSGPITGVPLYQLCFDEDLIEEF